MPMRVTSLASGSSGNALLIQNDTGALLIDCGLTQRALERHLRRAHISPADLTAIVLTHEHGDHSMSAVPFARRYSLPIVANRPTIEALGGDLPESMFCELPTGMETRLGSFAIRSFPVPHDAAEPVGYAISTAGWCVGVAIDLGSWDTAVLEGLAAADLVIIEANHDRERLRMAPYTWPVKQRIYSSLGHLDNVEAGELLARLASDGRRRTAWLAHLSEHANSPEIARNMVLGVLALANVTHINVHALPRKTPMVWESDQHGQQLELFAGMRLS